MRPLLQHKMNKARAQGASGAGGSTLLSCAGVSSPGVGGAEKLLRWGQAQTHRGLWDRGSLLCQLPWDLGHVLLQT